MKLTLNKPTKKCKQILCDFEKLKIEEVKRKFKSETDIKIKGVGTHLTWGSFKYSIKNNVEDEQPITPTWMDEICVNIERNLAMRKTKKIMKAKDSIKNI